MRRRPSWRGAGGAGWGGVGWGTSPRPAQRGVTGCAWPSTLQGRRGAGVGRSQRRLGGGRGGGAGGQGQANRASPAAKADLSTSRRTFRFSSTCYPETVFRIYILNCPSAFAAGCKWRPPTQPRPRALVAPHCFPEGPGEGPPATPERSLCHVGASGGAIPAFKPAGILARVQDGAAVAGHWDPGQDPGAV